MKLLITYASDSSNEAFDLIYSEVHKKLISAYPQHTFVHNDTSIQDRLGTANYGGISNLSIINTENSKCVILSFADIGDVHIQPGHGWEPYTLVKIFGAGSFGRNAHTKAEIKSRYGIEYENFQYPIAFTDFDEYATNNRRAYNPTERLRKVFFSGRQFPDRADILRHMRGHHLLDIFENGLPRYEYYDMMNKYVSILSLNGNAEFSIRDFEAMGMGIPSLRSELKSERYHPLIPNVHYIRGSDRSEDAWYTYSGKSSKEIADQFIYSIERIVHADELLTTVSANGLEYYTKYCKHSYIIDLFIKLFDPEILQ